MRAKARSALAFAALTGSTAATAAAEPSPRPAAAAPTPEPDPAPPRPRWRRALVEGGASLLVGATWYWIDHGRQEDDWDDPPLVDRLTLAAWRFDTNPFRINFAWHAFNGGGYHVLARANDLSLPASIGVGLAASFAWELVFEFREKVSVNDLIVTPAAGVPIGEVVHQLGRYLASAPSPRAHHRLASWTLGFWHALHGELDGTTRARPGARRDALGFDAAIWHRFRLAEGVVLAGDDRSSELRIELALAALPGYLAPGRFHRTFTDGNLGEGRVRIAGLLAGVALSADSLLVGHHVQDVDAGGRGGALTVAVSAAYDYRNLQVDDRLDRFALVHLPGAAIDAHLLHGLVRLRLSGRLHLDFAGVTARAYPAWKAAHPEASEPTILRRDGYYYGWGWSGSVRAELATRWLTAGGELFAGRYRAHRGLDKDQEAVDTDVATADRITDGEVYLRAATPWGLDLEVRHAAAHRASAVGAVGVDEVARRTTVAIGATF